MGKHSHKKTKNDKKLLRQQKHEHKVSQYLSQEETIRTVQEQYKKNAETSTQISQSSSSINEQYPSANSNVNNTVQKKDSIIPKINMPINLSIKNFLNDVMADYIYFHYAKVKPQLTNSTLLNQLLNINMNFVGQIPKDNLPLTNENNMPNMNDLPIININEIGDNSNISNTNNNTNITIPLIEHANISNNMIEETTNTEPTVTIQKDISRLQKPPKPIILLSPAILEKTRFSLSFFFEKDALGFFEKVASGYKQYLVAKYNVLLDPSDEQKKIQTLLLQKMDLTVPALRIRIHKFMVKHLSCILINDIIETSNSRNNQALQDIDDRLNRPWISLYYTSSDTSHSFDSTYNIIKTEFISLSKSLNVIFDNLFNKLSQIPQLSANIPAGKKLMHDILTDLAPSCTVDKETDFIYVLRTIIKGPISEHFSEEQNKQYATYFNEIQTIFKFYHLYNVAFGLNVQIINNDTLTLRRSLAHFEQNKISSTQFALFLKKLDFFMLVLYSQFLADFHSYFTNNNIHLKSF